MFTTAEPDTTSPAFISQRKIFTRQIGQSLLAHFGRSICRKKTQDAAREFGVRSRNPGVLARPSGKGSTLGEMGLVKTSGQQPESKSLR